MTANAILYPAVVLVFWTFVVLLLVPRGRFRAARERKVSARDFVAGESAAVPDDVRIPNRNYMNLLELPVLFYFGCLVLYVTGKVGWVDVTIGWAFVAARIVHSVVHLTYNNVIHRMRVFSVSVLMLVLFWLRIVQAL